MENKMIERINKKIVDAVACCAISQEYSVIANAEIRGMIEMLELVTGKEFYYDVNGVHERV